MKYRSGEVVEIGDSVTLERGKTIGVVHAIVETTQQMAEWGLSESGITVEAEPFGLVFWPESETDDALVFIARKRK